VHRQTANATRGMSVSACYYKLHQPSPLIIITWPKKLILFLAYHGQSRVNLSMAARLCSTRRRTYIALFIV